MNSLLKNTAIGTLTDIWLLLLRVLGGGGMFLEHGLPKWHKLMAGGTIKFRDPLHIGTYPSLLLAVFAEVFCALLLLLGVKSRLMSIPLMITMIVAAFVAHSDDPFAKKEAALLYLLLYGTIFVFGGGKHSIDGLRERNR